MPKVSPLIANPMERFFGTAVTITHSEKVSPSLRLVRFTSENFQKHPWESGQEIEFRINEKEFRHYTLMKFVAEEKLAEVLFYLNGKGPGSAWADELEVGRSLLLLGPGYKTSLPPEQDWYLLLGDETCIGAFAALRHALPASARVLGALIAEAENQDYVTALLPDLVPIASTDTSARERLAQWVGDLKLPQGSGAVHLAGNAQSIQQLRSLLTQQHLLSKKQIKTKPYWADGKQGL